MSVTQHLTKVQAKWNSTHSATQLAGPAGTMEWMESGQGSLPLAAAATTV
jgi:hypothetical protein